MKDLHEDGNELRLEAALRAALKREEAPSGFAERLESRLAEERKRRREWSVLTAIFRPVFALRIESQVAMAAALMLAIILPLGWRLHHQAEVARGEAAKQQVMLALRITGTQLRTIQERTQSIHAGGLAEGETQ
jgi:hypothetical protein